MTVGYEGFWSEHWSAGGNLAYVGYNNTYLLLPEVLLRHRSALGPLTFGQRLSVERTFPEPDRLPKARPTPACAWTWKKCLPWAPWPCARA